MKTRQWLCIAAFLTTGAAVGQAASPTSSETPAQFIASIERAHGRPAFDSKQALVMDYESSWGAKKRFKAHFLIERDMGRVRMEVDGGPVVVFDGSEAWVAPATSEFQGARFHVLTWPYFLLAPMKLADPGSHLKLLGERPLAGSTYEAARLTFDSGVGDAPKDWYVVYRDPKTSLLKAMAYIVTYSKPVSEAEKEPHAITYDDAVTVDGVTFATRWRFWNWSEAKGLLGEPIGEGRVSNLRFVIPDPNAFEKPEGARRDAKPTF